MTVGSNSNVGDNGMEREEERAAIWEVDPSTGLHRISHRDFATPTVWLGNLHRALWTVVNERDELGSDLVPDFLTSVREGGFYGWPYSYFGQNVDSGQTPTPGPGKNSIVPDYAMGRTRPVSALLPPRASACRRIRQGMFVGEHGSWNRNPRSGYKVVFVPFERAASGEPVDILTGFLSDEGKAYGRPVGVVIDHQGALLVADDVGNVIWRVTASGS